MLSEEKAVIDIDQMFFSQLGSFKNFYFIEYFRFYLSIVCVKFLVFAQFDGDDVPILFHVTTLEYLAKSSGAKQVVNQVTVANLLAHMGYIASFSIA